MTDPPPFVVLKAAGLVTINCKRCAYPLGLMTPDGLSITVAGITYRHRTTLHCDHCRKERTWVPGDERIRHGT